MLRTMSLALSAVALLLVAGCASEDPFEEPGEEMAVEEEEGVIGDPAEATGEGSSFTDALVDPATYCNPVANWTSTWADYESQVLTLVNQKRAAGATCGGVSYPPVPALTLDSRLRCSARNHSKDMGANNFFSHTGSDGSTFSQRITKAGYTWTGAAENIGAGYSTPAAAVNGWMASTGHCQNIMSKTLVHLGVGYYNAPTSTYKHYWTQSFGKP